MSCATCQVTPPPERSSPEPVHEGHVGHRFGDGGLGIAVLFRGQDWTLQTVEAFAGPEGEGWLEYRLMNDDGTYRFCGGADWTCPGCGGPRHMNADRRLDDEAPVWADCDECRSGEIPARPAYGPHVTTAIRRGMVQVVRGTEVISGPPVEAEVAS